LRKIEELNGSAVSALGVRSRKLSKIFKGRVTDGCRWVAIGPGCIAVVKSHSSFKKG
jgi:hypothetical protein